MTITCEIIIENNPHKVFYPGQNVNGHIELKISEPTKVKGINYWFGGKAVCKFSIKRGRTTTVYTVKEPYFEKRVDLVSSEQTLAVGTYNYPFSQEFPHGFTSSIEAPNGRSCHVRYSIEVVVEKPYSFNQKFKEYLTHIKPLDLNIFPLFRGPIAKSESTTFYWGGICVPMESDPIYVNAKLPSAGYTPGQSIDVTVHVDNNSNVNADFDVKLVQQFDLETKTREKEKLFLVNEQKNAYRSRAGTKNEFDVSLIVPPLPPTEQELSKIFRVKYYVSVVLRSSVFHRDTELMMPIVIGTYPYVDRNAKVHEGGSSSSAPYPENDPPT